MSEERRSGQVGVRVGGGRDEANLCSELDQGSLGNNKVSAESPVRLNWESGSACQSPLCAQLMFGFLNSQPCKQRCVQKEDLFFINLQDSLSPSGSRYVLIYIVSVHVHLQNFSLHTPCA